MSIDSPAQDQAGAALPDPPAALCMAMRAGLDDTACLGLFAAFERGVLAGLQPCPYPAAPRLPRRHVRIGYVVPRGGALAASTVLPALLRGHSRDRFDVFVYLQDGSGDAAAIDAIAAGADVLRDITHLQAHEAAGLVRCDDIDLLIDAGLPDTASTALLAHAPARGHFALGRALFAAPPADAALRALPFDPAMLAADPRVPDAALLPAPRAGTVLCCLTAPGGVDADSFAVWMRLLAGHTRASLLLADHGAQARDNLQRAARQAGIDPTRLFFAPADTPAQRVAAVATAGLFLDTLHCGSHDGVIAAVATATPVLALRGTRLAACLTANALEVAGLGDFAIESVDQLVARAGALCSDPAALERARARFAAAFTAEQVASRFATWLAAVEAACLARVGP